MVDAPTLAVEFNSVSSDTMVQLSLAGHYHLRACKIAISRFLLFLNAKKRVWRQHYLGLKGLI